MGIKRILILGTALVGLSAGVQSANAGSVCVGCEYIDTVGSMGTYLGDFDPLSFDEASFNHTSIQDNVGLGANFEDRWVFDVAPAGSGSITASFTPTSGIDNFRGSLHFDTGSTSCASAPSSPTACSMVSYVTPGFVMDSDNFWTLMLDNLAVGRYVLVVQGTTTRTGASSYGATIALAPAPVPTPSTLALLGLGLLGVGLRRRPRA